MLILSNTTTTKNLPKNIVKTYGIPTNSIISTKNNLYLALGVFSS